MSHRLLACTWGRERVERGQPHGAGDGWGAGGEVLGVAGG